MQTSTQVSPQFIPHQAIDKPRWDQLISQSGTPLPYAFSWYLDAVWPGWHALISGDYQAAMPLPAAAKYGIAYLRQPRFTQQLGIYTVYSLRKTDTAAFLQALPFFYGMLDMQWEPHIPLPHVVAKHAYKRPNYLLHMHYPYTSLYQNFNQNTRRNIKKSGKYGLNVVPVTDIRHYTRFKQNHAHNLYAADYERLHSLLTHASQQECGSLYAISHGNKWLAAAAFIRYQGRIIMINNASSEEGKNKRAMFFLLDKLIQEWAGTKLALDFEGSSIPGIARFFKGFGAQPEYYQHIHYYKWTSLRWINKLRKAMQ